MCWCDHVWWDRAVVTESLFQIDEPNTDKDTAALVPGEYVGVWKTLGIRGCSEKSTGYCLLLEGLFFVVLHLAW